MHNLFLVLFSKIMLIVTMHNLFLVLFSKIMLIVTMHSLFWGFIQEDNMEQTAESHGYADAVHCCGRLYYSLSRKHILVSKSTEQVLVF